MSVAENLTELRKRIHAAALRSDRNPHDVQIVAVTKTFPAEVIEDAISVGITVIGENRVQEAKQKYAVIGNKVEWHMVGHLQTNKVKDALKIFSLIHSLDSLKLAQELNHRANNKVHCLIEVNTSKESTKFGISPHELPDFYETVSQLPRLVIAGLMTIGPGWAIEDPEASRQCFRQLSDLKRKLQEDFSHDLPILSMGMTSDYEVAIEEGATHVRIGSALFGPRQH